MSGFVCKGGRNQEQLRVLGCVHEFQRDTNVLPVQTVNNYQVQLSANCADHAAKVVARETARCHNRSAAEALVRKNCIADIRTLDPDEQDAWIAVLNAALPCCIVEAPHPDCQCLADSRCALNYDRAAVSILHVLVEELPQILHGRAHEKGLFHVICEWVIGNQLSVRKE
eukprot:3940694-Rhodomonas_salina.1